MMTFEPFNRTSRIAPPIQVEGMYLDDIEKGESALEKIASKPNGKKLITKIQNASKDGRELKIQVSDQYQSEATAFLTEPQLNKYHIADESSASNQIAIDISQRKSFFRKGEGVKALVVWNPNEARSIDYMGHGRSVNDPSKAFTSLAHELVHALGFMKGTHYFDGSEPEEGTRTFKEEQRAIGIGPFEGDKISENGIREEHGLPKRQEY
ncbi:hypothetical protein F3J37_01635 [Pantoea sp. Al-1710]|uniref:Uncharacterized protein n=1 Tax=Candidatus Pantoea communis TaxID=2608354 RepID=A0ABX0RNY7_9GAMM|nr:MULTISPECIES: XopG/HopH/AvrPtoH family type III secretion system effector [Pantoea]NIG12919.1 hypothetical protein [Pantoea sp. Cy-640]NIG17380.1 hypothetical protein [Pantoea communis]